MAAGTNAYSANRIRTVHDGSDDILALLALALSAYGDEETLKRLFYLDWVDYMPDKNGRTCFVGGTVPGSKNEAMHAVARRGAGMWMRKNQDGSISNKRWFNDAGLNTLPFMTFSVTLNYENYYRFSVNVKSAYYSLTTSWGVYLKNNTNGQEYYMQLSTAIVNANATYSGTVTYDKKIQGFNSGDSVTIKPYAVNEEGRFIGDGYSVTLQSPIRIVELDRYIDSGDIYYPPENGNTEKYIGILQEYDYTREYGINQMLNMDTTGIPKPYPYQSLVDVEGAKGSTFNVAMLSKKLPYGYYYGFENQNRTKKFMFKIGQTESDTTGMIRGWLEPRERTGRIVVTTVSSILGTGKIRISVQLTGDAVQYPASVKGALQTPLKMNGQPTNMWVAVSTHTLTVTNAGIASIEVSKGNLSAGDKIRFIVTEVAGATFPSSDLDKATYNESTYVG